MSTDPNKPTHLPPVTLRGDAARQLRIQREAEESPPPAPPPPAPVPQLPAQTHAQPPVQLGAPPPASPVRQALYQLAMAAALAGLAYGTRRAIDRIAKRFRR